MAESLAIFDIGDTLVTGPSRGPARRIGSELGFDDSQRRALHDALMTVDFPGPPTIADWIERELGVAGAGPAVEAVWLAQEGEAEPIDGALETLEGLHGAGVRLALLSNIWAPYLTAVRRHFGPFFSAHIAPELQVFSYEIGVAKPDPRGFEQVLRHSGVPADRCVMIGDTHALDIAPASRLGLRTIWSVGAVTDAPEPPPTRAVRTVAEIDPALIEAVLR